MTPNEKSKASFDPSSFSPRSLGRKIVDFGIARWVSRRVTARTPYFMSQKGKLKLTVVSDQGKEAVIAILEAATSSARVAWRADQAHGDGYGQ